MATVSVHALSAGSLTIPEKFFVVPSDPDVKFTVPSLSFLIQHKTNEKTTRIVFDLGLRRDTNLYPDVLQNHIKSRQPMATLPDVTASLAEGNLTPTDIDTVILSHVHYDHVGYPLDFPISTFLTGPGALSLLSGATTLNIGSHSHFEPNLLPPTRTIELPSPSSPAPSQSSSFPTTQTTYTWRPLPPFPHTIDLFSDASCYIIHAPGHLPGHINLLCRISTSPAPKYVYLAGDACHDIRLFRGEREIATWTDAGGRYCCIHADREETMRTLRRIREAVEGGLMVEADGDVEADNGGGGAEGPVKAQVEVVFAHDWEWERRAREEGRFWPGKL